MPRSVNDISPTRTVIRPLAMAAALMLTVSCGYRPGGQGWKGSSETFQSTEFRPATLTLVDVRTGEEIWTQDIPVGYQIVTRFIEGGNPGDRINRPDRLEYQVFQIGSQYGKLRSAVAVPAAGVRRWELAYRQGPEFAEDGIRTGHLGNTPPWFELPPRPWPDHLNNPNYNDVDDID